jgi:tetratricopeptide (TPR) repeat protein
LIPRTVIVVLLFGVIAAGASAMEYHPQPMQKTAAESAFEKEVLGISSTVTLLQTAKEYMERYPDDVPLGVYASDVIYRSSERKAEALDYIGEFAAAHWREIGAQYYYARLAQDTLVWDQKARWALAKDSTSFWAWLMWVEAEWHKSNPDMEAVIDRLQHAVSLDPSRPEGYLELGRAYTEQGEWEEARDAYQAGLVCDPGNDYIRQRLEDIKDRVHLIQQEKESKKKQKEETPATPQEP